MNNLPKIPEDSGFYWPGMVWQDIRFTPEQIQMLRDLVQKNLGIHISHEKDYLLASKFVKMMDSVGIQKVRELIDLLQRPTTALKLQLARFLTTNHTFFFREPDHFQILSELIKKNARQKPRIWCAASSTGEEVYSIIIFLLEAGIQDFMILASDINLEVLKACRRGIYSQEKLKAVSKYLTFKYFDRVGQSGDQQWQVKAELRQRVILKRLNLVESLRFEDNFHYIFCRNVMIYFDQATQKKVVSNLLANLAPNGFLFVGHSEPLVNIQEKIVQEGISLYRKSR